MKNVLILFLLIIGNIALQAQDTTNENRKFSMFSGPYLGQKLPGIVPELFAPGIISDGMVNRDVAISPNGNEMYFSISTQNFSFSSIIVSKQINGKWTKPEVAPFAADPRYKYIEPAFGSDGKRFFFASNMPKDGTETPGDFDIWAIDIINGEWGKPYNIGEPVNTPGGEFFPSITKDGTLYFTRNDAGVQTSFIYRSRFIKGKYTTPEKLPEQINCGEDRYNAYVAKDESFVVIPAQGVEKGKFGALYYIVFRNTDGSWQNPVNMGPQINTPAGRGWSFYISPDNKYLFFMATRSSDDKILPPSLSLKFFQKKYLMPQNGNPDIYWADSKILEGLKP